MITKRQIRISYIEEISIKKAGKKINYYQMQKKKICKTSANSLAMITKEQIRINYIEKISIKGYPRKIKYYQI